MKLHSCLFSIPNCTCHGSFVFPPTRLVDESTPLELFYSSLCLLHTYLNLLFSPPTNTHILFQTATTSWISLNSAHTQLSGKLFRFGSLTSWLKSRSRSAFTALNDLTVHLLTKKKERAWRTECSKKGRKWKMWCARNTWESEVATLRTTTVKGFQCLWSWHYTLAWWNSKPIAFLLQQRVKAIY